MPLLQDPCTDRKVFFAHAPRTGGRTVEAMFVNTNKWKSTLTSMYLPLWWTDEISFRLMLYKPECAYYEKTELSHLCYEKYRDFIDPSTTPSFTICRNPLTRFQSYVSYSGLSNPLNRKSLVSTAEGRSYLENNWDDQDLFLKPQYKYCNQYIKIWKFEDGFGPNFISWLNKEFNLNLIYSPINRSNTKFDTQGEKKPLHPEVIDFLNGKYEWDFNYFGYSYG